MKRNDEDGAVITSDKQMESAAPERDGHSLHIPVMGIGFTVDTPARMAKYGITSVISLVDDTLIEQMRKHYCEREGEDYEPIARGSEDHRARRITRYLDLLGRIISRETKALKLLPFEAGSDITRFFELLPPCPSKKLYEEMLDTEDEAKKARLQEELRQRVTVGRTEVNIMTKLDRDNYRGNEKLPPQYTDASAALRGFANSKPAGGIVFSAGLNQRLYSYASEFDCFYPDEQGELNKQIVLKVSDYRSALIQGRFLAKKGLWISEFRIESGLNCGGHAFAGRGHLIGPVLEEFKNNREQLIGTLHKIYTKALIKLDRKPTDEPRPVKVTAQGGIGTAAENRMLMDVYHLDGTGWGTPFLLVPEVSNVDEEHIAKLAAATSEEVYLSDASPLHVPFWNLYTSASEIARRRRIDEGVPGSACPKGHGALKIDMADVPICVSSRWYVKKRLEALEEEDISEEKRERLREYILAKSCICHDLSGGATRKNDIDPDATTSICCGLSITDFSAPATLEMMLGHIYGLRDLLTNDKRPHMFVRELRLNVEFVEDLISKYRVGLTEYTNKVFDETKANLIEGIEYYRAFAERLAIEEQAKFLEDLEELFAAISAIEFPAMA